jgi:hypothetical protein
MARRRTAPKRHAGHFRFRSVLAELLEDRRVLAASDVVISEIMYHPSATNTGGEYVELYNRGDAAVDLGGWRIADGVDFQFAPGTQLAAREHLLVYHDAAAIDFYKAPRAVGPFPRRLNNNGDRIELRDQAGNVIDAVAYDNDLPWPTEADGSGVSLELLDASADNGLAATWGIGQPYSPGKANQATIPGSGDIVLTEIMYRPEMRRYVQPIDPIANQAKWEDGEDPRGEYLEFHHRGTTTVDLSGWRVEDDEGLLFEFPEGSQMGPGDYRLVAADSGAIQSRYGITNVAGSFRPGTSLSNNRESIALLQRDGKLIDFVRYRSDEGWPLAPDQLGTSLELIDAREDNRHAANWRSSQVPRAALPAKPAVGDEFYVTRGTPGKANSVAATSLPPFVSRDELRHSPKKPTSGDPIVITARPEHSRPLTEVTLLLETRVAPYQTATSSELPMRDDGRQGDAVAGDGVYSAQLDPQASQTLVRYRVRVADAVGASATWPDLLDPNPNGAFFTYDGEHESRMPAYFLIVPTATQKALDANIWLSEFLDATLVADGVVYDHIGIHYRGRGWRVHPKKSYHIAFNKGEFFRGQSRLDLAMHFPTMQHMTHQLMAAAGAQPLGSEPIKLFRNGKLFGLMLAQESPNSSWLDANDLGDGEVYKASAAPNFSQTGFTGTLMADLDYFADSSVYPRLYEKKGDALGSYDSIIQLTNVIANTPDDQLVVKLRETIELDSWLTQWAVNVIGGNGDIIGTNFTLVRPEALQAKWQMRSFDFSHFFGCQMLDFVDVICNPYTQDPFLYYNHFHHRVMKHPQLKDRFLHILEDLLKHQLSPERVSGWIDRTFQMYEADRLQEVALNIPGPPTHYVVHGSDQREIKEYYAKRAAWLMDQWIPAQGIQPLANQHPTIVLRPATQDDTAATIRWTHADTENDASVVDLFWSDGKWRSFQPIPGGQGLNAADGQFRWGSPPGRLNSEVFIQAVIRDSKSDLVGRDMSYLTPPPPTPQISISGTDKNLLTITRGMGANDAESEPLLYTTDGTDPRGADGRPSVTARVYTGPVTLTQNGMVRVRAVAGMPEGPFDWSDMAETFAVVEVPELVVTEVMYNPVPGTDYEFIELFNRGDKPITLRDIVADGRGPLFDFSKSLIPVLAPQEYIVLVKNLAKFQEHYDTRQVKIAGVFELSLSNTTQNINLKLGPDPTPFLTFKFVDTWHPSTDGGGPSLVLADPHVQREAMNAAAAWRPSLSTDGSPGRADTAIPDINLDMKVDARDLDLLCERIAARDLRYDFSQDGRMDSADLLRVVQDVLKTTAGDANLDGIFNTADLVAVFQAGLYEAVGGERATWGTGDWDCDGRFTTRDLVLAFQSGGYLSAARPAADEAAAAGPLLADTSRSADVAAAIAAFWADEGDWQEDR